MKRRTLIRCALLFAGVAGLVLVAGRADAGIVILRNGRVFIGRLRSKNISPDTIVMEWPYKDKQTRGRQKFEHGNAPHNIRWYWQNPDPNKIEDLSALDQYWEKYNDTEKYPIESKYLPLLARWLEGRKARESGTPELVVLDDPLTRGQRLSPVVVDGGPFGIRYPDTWRGGIENGIVILTAPKPGTDGFRPRIHVFATRSVVGQTADQIDWFLQQVGRASDQFEVREKKRLRTRPNGFDQELLTLTSVKNRPILAMRKVYFREKYTYFFNAYAHEQDYAGLKSLFERVMSSLVINEDKTGGDKKKKKTKAAKEPAKKTD